MNEVQQRRRNAHYNNTETAEEAPRRGGFKIFVQLMVCMALIFGAFYCSSKTLPTGETVQKFITHATGHNSDISAPVAWLRGFIAEKAGPILLPDPGDSSVFNETTPKKQEPLYD